MGVNVATQFEKLRTVSQLADLNPAFTEPSLRWLIFNARSNGLDQAITRIGRRVYVDLDKFDRWIKQQGDLAALRK